MKLSEAIREGIRKDGKQVFGTMFSIKWERGGTSTEGFITGCCALGAAYIGLGYDPLTDPNAIVLLEKLYGGDLVTRVIELNDGELWTREDIAGHLESIGQ